MLVKLIYELLCLLEVLLARLLIVDLYIDVCGSHFLNRQLLLARGRSRSPAWLPTHRRRTLSVAYCKVLLAQDGVLGGLGLAVLLNLVRFW